MEMYRGAGPYRCHVMTYYLYALVDVSNQFNQLWFLAWQTHNFHIKGNDGITGNPGLARRCGATLFAKRQFALFFL
jgi:hypothetical protein